MHIKEIIDRVWDILDLDDDDRTTNDTYSPTRVVRALNLAAREVVRRAAQDTEAGHFSTTTNLSVSAGDTSVALPTDFVRARRLYSSTTGEPLQWAEGRGDYILAGVRLSGDSIVWDLQMARDEAWVLDYVRQPSFIRVGTLSTQDGGNAANQVDLPSSDSEGALSAVADAYADHHLALLDGDGEGRHTISSYSTARKATLDADMPGTPASGDAYALSEDWPDVWGEVLAAAAALRLPDGAEIAGVALQMALMTADRDRRVTQRARRVGYNPEA